MVTVLPSFIDKEGNKWTVDAKLKEFRRVYRDGEYNLKIEFVPFDAEKGKLLMSERLKKLGEVL